MKSKSILAVGALALAMAASPASAKTFKWAFQGDAGSLDPHSLNESFLLGFLGNVYEPLIDYDRDMKKIPGLATKWEAMSPTKWKFTLRKGVKFHNGNAFTADDVIFSWKRMLTDGSDQKSRAALISNITKVDDYTIIVETPVPNPTVLNEMTNMYIMDKEWAEANNATKSASPKDAGRDKAYSTTHANGTGPFKIESRQPDVKTVFVRYDGHWNKNIATNITRVEFTPVKQAATRVAALLSGQLDLAYPIPVQDWNRLKSSATAEALTGPEARTIFLGFDQTRKELVNSSVKGKNPFKDVRVRRAFAHAIDLNAIKVAIMRGAATPSGLMWAPQIQGFNAAANKPYKYDPAASKKLLAEAGYPNGFSLTMDCPNNRYVNDEKICQAVASMLAKVGVKVNLLAQPKSKYFAKVLAQNGYDTSFYLLGWTPGSMDVYNVFNNLIACRNKEKKAGFFNLGGYCNPKLDAHIPTIASETDVAKRQAAIDAAAKILHDDVGYLPLHQQPLSWGVRKGVKAAQRADNILDFRDVVMP